MRLVASRFSLGFRWFLIALNHEANFPIHAEHGDFIIFDDALGVLDPKRPDSPAPYGRLP